MSTVKVQYYRSEKWQNAEFVATGNRPHKQAQVDFDLTQATIEQRQQIAAFGKVDAYIDIQTDSAKLDAEPTLDQVISIYQAQKAAEEAKEAAAKVAREFVRQQDAENREMRQRWERDAEEKAEAAKLARETAKATWVAEHGSDRLRRAVERGHDCMALYVRERAAVEASGYVADIYDGAEWKAATCPGSAALDEADAAEALGLGNVEIVWLTARPIDIKRTDDEEYYEYERYQPGEAIVIRQYLGKYDLVRKL